MLFSGYFGQKFDKNNFNDENNLLGSSKKTNPFSVIPEEIDERNFERPNKIKYGPNKIDISKIFIIFLKKYF